MGSEFGAAITCLSFRRATINGKAIVATALLLAATTATAQEPKYSDWHLDMNYSLTGWSLGLIDTGLAFASNPIFSVAGIGIGYSVNPHLVIEGRYRISSIWTGSNSFNCGFRVRCSHNLSLRFSALEPSFIYKFAPDATVSAHIRAGIQRITIEAAGSSSTVYLGRTIRTSRTSFNLTGDSEMEWFVGLGLTFTLSDKWYMRSEYFSEYAGDAASVIGSAGFRF